MATTYTTNYNLGKQENHADKFDMDVITDNADKIDAALTELQSGIDDKQAALTTEQLAAVNSGVTSTDVAQIGLNKNNILSLDEEANALANNDRKNIITLYSFPMIVGGVTITQDLDTGELVFNGTASGTGFHYAYIGNAAIESGKMYGFVDSLYGGNTLYAYVGSTSVFNENYPVFLSTRGNRVAIADGYPSIVVRLVGGTTYNNQRLSPMLFAGEITDNTYQPPAETNAHLTQQLQYAQFRRIKDNTSTVTFNLKRTDTQDRYHYGFVLFGNVTNLPSIYAVFIGAESTNPTVSFAKVGGGIEGALTGSVEYNGLNVTLTITSTSTLYGGIRLVWLD